LLGSVLLKRAFVDDFDGSHFFGLNIKALIALSKTTLFIDTKYLYPTAYLFDTA
jgi:hypothetical protein